MKKTLLFLAAMLTIGLAANAQISTFPWLVDFEGSAMPSNFTFVDNDGDGKNWYQASSDGIVAHSGTGVATSASYQSVALTPDNWMITPAIAIPTDADTNFCLSWWVVGQDPSWAYEYFSVYIATGNTVADFLATPAPVYTGYATPTYAKFMVELSSYAGQTIYVAFRHHNVTDMFRINIDDIRIGGPEPPTVELAGPNEVAFDIHPSATYTVNTDGSDIAWYVNGVQQTETTTTFNYTFPAVGVYVVKVGVTNIAGTVYDSITVNALNATVTSFPWSEDFESIAVNDDGVGVLPVGWTTYADNVPNYYYDYFTQGWDVYDFGWNGKSAFCYTYTNSTNPCDRWMVTTKLSIPTDATEMYLKFDVYGSQYNESLAVMVSTTGNDKSSFTNTLMPTTVLDAGSATRLFDLSSYAGQDIFIAFRCTTTDGMNTAIDNIEVTDQLPHDAIAYVDGAVDNYVPMGETFNFYTLVRNMGSNNLTSYTLTYTLNNETPLTRNVTGINVAPYDYYIDTITISYATAGALNINLTVSDPNGQTDPELGDNDGTLQATVYDPATVVERNTLLEHFTTAVCVNCPAAHTRLEQAIGPYEDRVMWVAHHVGYNTDDMTYGDDNSAQGVMGFYTGTYSFAPGMILDRDPELVPGEYGGIVGGVGQASEIASQFANAISAPAYVSVALENVNYNPSTRQVSFDVNGQFKQAFTGDVNLTVYVTEDGIIGSQTGATGDYQHNHVLRGVVTAYWGDALQEAGTADANYTKHYTYTLPETWRASQCRLVAFVNKYAANDFYNRQVLNATQTGYLSTPEGIENATPAISVKMWPNPAAEMAYVEAESTIRNYVVVNALGQRVMGAENVNADVLELNVSNLAAGVYYVSVTTDNGVSTERMSVVK